MRISKEGVRVLGAVDICKVLKGGGHSREVKLQGFKCYWLWKLFSMEYRCHKQNI